MTALMKNVTLCTAVKMDVSNQLLEQKMYIFEVACHGGVHKDYCVVGYDVKKCGRSSSLCPEDRRTAFPEISVYLYQTIRRQI